MEAKGDKSGSIGQSSYKSCGCLDTAYGGYVFLSTGDLGDRDFGRVTGNCSRSTGLPEVFKGRKLEHKKTGIAGCYSECCFLGAWVVIEIILGGKDMRRKYGMMIFVMAIVFLSFFQAERASADLIWEPFGDSFFDAHRGECQYLGRSYIANGLNGELVVYKSPENPSIVTKIPNGSAFGCYYSYQDKAGITWALYNDFTTDVSGWVPYDYLVVKYDYISFEEEFGEQIVAEQGQLDSEWSKQEICIWSYPGSREGSKMTLSSEYLPEYSASYIDEAGRKWVYGGYYMGCRNYWVCLDAPTDDYTALYPERDPT